MCQNGRANPSGLPAGEGNRGQRVARTDPGRQGRSGEANAAEVVLDQPAKVQALAVAMVKDGEKKTVVAAVESIEAISEKGCHALFEALKDKLVKLKDAEEILDQPHDIQGKAVALVKDRKAETLAKAIGKILMCPTCQRAVRVGQTVPTNCKECAELQNRPKGKGPKSGSVKFDDKIITDLFGKLVQAVDARSNAYGKTEKCKACFDAIKMFEAAWSQWRVS